MQTREDYLQQFKKVQIEWDLDIILAFRDDIPKNIEPLEELFPNYWEIFEETFYKNFKKDGYNKHKNNFKFTLRTFISWMLYFFRGITYDEKKIIAWLEKEIDEFEPLFQDIIREQIEELKKKWIKDRRR